MASVNKVTILGHLGRDPETRTFQNGDKIANVRIATTDKWRDKNTGEARESTEWHSVVFSARLAEVVGQYLRKGSLVYVEGSLRTRKWTDQSGQERYTTEIRADSLQMLGGNRANAGAAGGQGGEDYGRSDSQESQRRAPAPAPAARTTQQAASNTEPAQQPAGFDDWDTDIPF